MSFWSNLFYLIGGETHVKIYDKSVTPQQVKKAIDKMSLSDFVGATLGDGSKSSIEKE